MDISLEKDFLQDLEKSSNIEWLEKNTQGIYSSSTITGMNTRREHGLFVVPDNKLKKKIVLLSKFEESVFIENRIHEISTNTYSGGIFPQGYKYLKSFKMKPFPSFVYEIEGRIIEKTVFLLSDHPLLIVRYELKNQGNPLNLIVKPFLADRFSTDLTKEIQGLNTDSYLGNYFVRWALKPGMPEINVYYSAGEFISNTLWYKNFTYPKDTNKYNDSMCEHLFNPGFFQTTLTPYHGVDLYISTKELDTDNLNYEALFREEKGKRETKKDTFFTSDKYLLDINSSLRKSLINIDKQSLISVSFMENINTNRDMILSLPGFFLVNKDYDGFKKQYLYLIDQLTEGLLPVHSPLMKKKNHYCASDLSLMLINLGYLYFNLTKDKEFFNNGVYQCFQSVIDYYLKGTLNNIYVDKDHLVFSGSKTTSTSWIPLTGENNEVLRFGKLLEVNSLWYNALKIMELLSKELGKKRKVSKYSKLAEKVKTSFLKTFVQEDNSLSDFIAHDKTNNDFRINQILPLALPFSPLNEELKSIVLSQIDQHLLTPYGLRASKKNGDLSTSNLNRKISSFYDGTIWPWTVDLYVSAALSCSDNKEEKALQMAEYFSPLPKLIKKGMLNHLPEALTDSDFLNQSGIVDFTPSLSCLLWAFFQINKYSGVQ
jgi:predicted glycogen debranching enzyme